TGSDESDVVILARWLAFAIGLKYIRYGGVHLWKSEAGRNIPLALIEIIHTGFFLTLWVVREL
ncbi:MAG: hypothetical protein ABIV42_04995, partial [Nitrosospira sp.]